MIRRTIKVFFSYVQNKRETIQFLQKETGKKELSILILVHLFLTKEHVLPQEIVKSRIKEQVGA